MNERPGGERWWEFDPAEKPVPLDGEGWKISDDAELIVNSHREAIGREDTEPTLQTLSQLQSPGDSAREISLPRAAAHVALGVLVAGCVAMFFLGWVRGSATAENAAMPDRDGRSTEVAHVTDGISPSGFTDGSPGRSVESKEVGRR